VQARIFENYASRNHLEARTVNSKADSSLEVGLAAQRGHYAALPAKSRFRKLVSETIMVNVTQRLR
jgi:hypothetical protein